MTCTITPSIPGLGNYRISMTKTGDTSACVEVDSWPEGVPAVGTPQKANELNLKNVNVGAGIITGDVVEPWYVPTEKFSIVMSAAQEPHSASVTVAGLFSKSFTAPLSDADYNALKAWLAAF